MSSVHTSLCRQFEQAGALSLGYNWFLCETAPDSDIENMKTNWPNLMVITSLGHKLDLVVGRRSALSDSDAVWGHTTVGEPVSITSNSMSMSLSFIASERFLQCLIIPMLMLITCVLVSMFIYAFESDWKTLMRKSTSLVWGLGASLTKVRVNRLACNADHSLATVSSFLVYCFLLFSFPSDFRDSCFASTKCKVTVETYLTWTLCSCLFSFMDKSGIRKMAAFIFSGLCKPGDLVTRALLWSIKMRQTQ